jgi:hypothetical protein
MPNHGMSMKVRFPPMPFQGLVRIVKMVPLENRRICEVVMLAHEILEANPCKHNTQNKFEQDLEDGHRNCIFLWIVLKE